MEVSYKLNLDDYLAFAMHNFQTSKSMQRSFHMGYLWVPLSLVIFTLVTAGVEIESGLAFLIIWAPALLVIMLYLFTYPYFYRWTLKRNTLKFVREGQNAGLLCQHRITINESGLVETTDVGETRALWSGVERVEASDNHIFIYIGAAHAHVIPKWAFSSRQQAEEFFAAAQKYQRSMPA